MSFQSTLNQYLDEQKLSGTEAIKARVKAKVKAKFDKIEKDRIQSIRQDNRQKEVDAFMKAHSAKMKQKIISDKLEGKY